jgi:F0F1-type ATP synthase assembly protein I
MSPPAAPHDNRSDDTFGIGIEAGVMLMIFSALGWFVDRWLATTPWFTIGLFLLGAVGLFYRFKAEYTNRIDDLARQRRDGRTRPGAP